MDRERWALVDKLLQSALDRPAAERDAFVRDACDGDTEVEVVESGFDALPAGRRDEAFRMNSGGWEQQMANIRDHVS